MFRVLLFYVFGGGLWAGGPGDVVDFAAFEGDVYEGSV